MNNIWSKLKFKSELIEISNKLSHIDLTFVKLSNNYVYDSCSEDFVRILNKKNKDQIIGRSDFDLGWRDTCAIVCRSEDELVTATKKPIIDRVEYVVSQPDAQDDYHYAHLVVGFRKPILSATGEVIAVSGSYKTVADMSDTYIENYWQNNKKKRYYLFPENKNIYLTTSEAKFLFYLLNKPEKLRLSDLCIYLHITTNTVYTYIRNIKDKIGINVGESIYDAVARTIFYDYFRV